MKKKHVVYIVSNVKMALPFEWIASRLHQEFQFTFLVMNPGPSSLESFLRKSGIAVHRIPFRGKIDYVSSSLRILSILLRLRPDVVHAHLWEAQLIGLSCAWLARIKSRIYTRHTSNYHHLYHPPGIKYDRLCNRMATRIVSISQATYTTLKDLEGVPERKIVKIPHGFDWTVFEQVTPERILAVRSKWRIPESRPTIGVISRLVEWKGVQYIVPAFKAFLQDYPKAHLVLANAWGPLKGVIDELLVGIPPARLTLVTFEEDVAAMYRTFDIFVHVPVDPLVEAFGQTYVEALASGVPAIFTNSGIAAEFIEDRRNALIVPFKDSKAIENSLRILWNESDLRARLVEQGRRDVTSKFGLDPLMNSLRTLYAR